MSNSRLKIRYVYQLTFLRTLTYFVCTWKTKKGIWNFQEAFSHIFGAGINIQCYNYFYCQIERIYTFIVDMQQNTFLIEINRCKFFCHPGCSAFAYTIPFGILDTSLRPGGEVWGCLGSKLSWGGTGIRNRDLLHASQESGVIAIMLRGPPPLIDVIGLNFQRVAQPNRSTSLTPRCCCCFCYCCCCCCW